MDHFADTGDEQPETPADASAEPPGEEPEGETDWSFTEPDSGPVTEDSSETLSAEDIRRIEQTRELELEREEEARREIERELDEAGRRRRQNVRVNVQLPVTIRVSGHPGTKARSRDLSATGVGFATRLPIDVDTPGTVTIHFADWNFTKEMVVRFVKPILAGRQVGAQFTELTEDERERVVKEVFAVQRAQLQLQRMRQKGE